MNYLPFCGYWFYGAGLISAESMASFFCSWGLLAVAPITGIVIPIFMAFYRRLRG